MEEEGMELTERQKKIWKILQSELAKEPVAGLDHVERMTTWCERIGKEAGADMDVLVSGALLHDIGVPINRKKHYEVGKARAAEILKKTGFPEDKIDAAVHVGEAHSRYGGPDPQTLEAKVGQDADALEYIGAIGIIRAVVRGLNDGSFDGNVNRFPSFLRSVMDKVKGTFHTHQAEKIAQSRLEYMQQFLVEIEKELNFQA
jgi:uncharacterized protein